MKILSVGREASGVVAVGLRANGVVAIGHVARGVVAIGNVAFGLVAIGNVAVGAISAGGLGIAIAPLAWAAFVAAPVVHGGAPVLVLHELVSLLLLVAAGMLLRGRRTPRPKTRKAVPIESLRSGAVREGWIRAELDDVDADRIVLVHRGERIVAPATAESLRRAEEVRAVRVGTGRRARVLVHLRAQESPADESLYRDLPPSARVLVCAKLREAPERLFPWQSAADSQFWLARAWRVAALLGIVALGVRHLV